MAYGKIRGNKPTNRSGRWGLMDVFDWSIEPILAFGGNVTEVFVQGTLYKVHEFSAVGTSSFDVASLGTSDGLVEYLVIAGGGGTSGYACGGAGAGGYRSSVSGEMSGGGSLAEAKFPVQIGSYAVTVGAGGTAGGCGVRGGNGGNSSFASITSIGGGAPSDNTSCSPFVGQFVGTVGGSGAGGSGYGQNGPVYRTGTNGTINQGFKGGNATGAGTAGGGGAGEPGKDNPVAGSFQDQGGDGVQSLISGNLIYRAGGGGSSSGGGGLGGGGTGDSGLPNTGGGAGRAGGGNGRTGGSGVVFIRYPIAFVSKG